MKTSILFLIVSVGFGANSWAMGPYDSETENGHPDSGYTPTTQSNTGSSNPGNTTANTADKGTYKPGSYYTTDANGKVTNSGSGGSEGCRNGTFGGASCETTNNINMGVQISNQVYQAVGQAAVSNKNTDVVNTLNSKGINVSNADFLEGQAKNADTAHKSNRNAGLMQTVNAGLQGWRAIEHRKSRKEIYSNANKEFQDLDAKRLSCKDASCEALIRKQQDDLVKEYRSEDRAQKNKALESTIMAGQTAALAGKSLTEANMAKKTAEELRRRAAMGGGGEGQFYMNQQTFNGPDDGNLNPTPTVEAEAVVTNDPNGGLGLDGGIKDFNPNLGNNTAAGPAPGAFQEGAAAKGGGGQGAGLGGSGGTSASRGDGGEGKQEGGPGKGQTGGQYASGDGAAPKFSRSGGLGAGVGVDSSFADMLKKMLPGGEDEKKDDHASLDIDQDRGPASDQAAVIGRNKNIFIEISKRYQKKNNEGAVIFQ